MLRCIELPRLQLILAPCHLRDRVEADATKRKPPSYWPRRTKNPRCPQDPGLSTASGQASVLPRPHTRQRAKSKGFFRIMVGPNVWTTKREKHGASRRIRPALIGARSALQLMFDSCDFRQTPPKRTQPPTPKPTSGANTEPAPSPTSPLAISMYAPLPSGTTWILRAHSLYCR